MGEVASPLNVKQYGNSVDHLFWN